MADWDNVFLNAQLVCVTYLRCLTAVVPPNWFGAGSLASVLDLSLKVWLNNLMGEHGQVSAWPICDSKIYP